MQTKYRVLSLIVGVLAIAAFAIPEANAAAAHLWHATGLDLSPLVAFAAVAGPGVRLRELNSKRAALVETMQALNAKADFDETTDGATYAAHATELAGIKAAIERENTLIAEAAQAGISKVFGAAVEENIEQDPRRGFASFGHFAAQVGAAGRGDYRAAQALQAAAPSTFGNESAGADGGFLVPPQFSQDIWRLAMGEDSLIPQTQNVEISGNSMVFPKDETTPWGAAGVQAYWQAEGSASSASKPVFGANIMQLHKLMALVPVTEELMQDGAALGTYLPPLASDRITWKANEAILFGDGIGKPLGALSGGAAVIQAKDSGQAANTLTAANISNMVTRLLAGELGNAFWLATPDILPYLEALTVGQYPIYLPGQSAANAPYGLLKGRPLILSEHANAFSSQGDLNLVSLKGGYRTITKAGGVQTDTSMHLYFDAAATAFRFIFRINGAPVLSKPVTPPKSTVTRSHFVTLAAR